MMNVLRCLMLVAMLLGVVAIGVAPVHASASVVSASDWIQPELIESFAELRPAVESDQMIEPTTAMEDSADMAALLELLDQLDMENLPAGVTEAQVQDGISKVKADRRRASISAFLKDLSAAAQNVVVRPVRMLTTKGAKAYLQARGFKTDDVSVAKWSKRFEWVIKKVPGFSQAYKTAAYAETLNIFGQAFLAAKGHAGAEAREKAKIEVAKMVVDKLAEFAVESILDKFGEEAMEHLFASPEHATEAALVGASRLEGKSEIGKVLSSNAELLKKLAEELSGEAGEASSETAAEAIENRNYESVIAQLKELTPAQKVTKITHFRRIKANGRELEMKKAKEALEKQKAKEHVDNKKAAYTDDGKAEANKRWWNREVSVKTFLDGCRTVRDVVVRAVTGADSPSDIEIRELVIKKLEAEAKKAAANPPAASSATSCPMPAVLAKVTKPAGKAFLQSGMTHLKAGATPARAPNAGLPADLMDQSFANLGKCVAAMRKAKAGATKPPATTKPGAAPARARAPAKKTGAKKF